MFGKICDFRALGRQKDTCAKTTQISLLFNEINQGQPRGTIVLRVRYLNLLGGRRM